MTTGTTRATLPPEIRARRRQRRVLTPRFYALALAGLAVVEDGMPDGGQ